MLSSLAAVAAGSALGGLLRYLVGVLVAPASTGFPWATLVVNGAGSLLLGMLAVTFLQGSPTAMRLFWTVGLCGGFTTFSAFALDTVTLAATGAPWRAAANVAANLLLCLGAAAGGLALGRALLVRG